MKYSCWFSAQYSYSIEKYIAIYMWVHDFPVDEVAYLLASSNSISVSKSSQYGC